MTPLLNGMASTNARVQPTSAVLLLVRPLISSPGRGLSRIYIAFATRVYPNVYVSLLCLLHRVSVFDPFSRRYVSRSTKIYLHLG